MCVKSTCQQILILGVLFGATVVLKVAVGISTCQTHVLLVVLLSLILYQRGAQSLVHGPVLVHGSFVTWSQSKNKSFTFYFIYFHLLHLKIIWKCFQIIHFSIFNTNRIKSKRCFILKMTDRLMILLDRMETLLNQKLNIKTANTENN